MTSRSWSAISLSISPGESAGGSRPSRPRSWTPWRATPGPGNVRELQNVIERSVILSPGPALQVLLGDLQPAVTQAPEPTAAAVTLAEAEREHILDALRETGWVVAGPKGAAARLGMKRSTLQEKMRKLGISRPE